MFLLGIQSSNGRLTLAGLLDSRHASPVPWPQRGLAARTPSASPAQRAGYDVSEARGNDGTARCRRPTWNTLSCDSVTRRGERDRCISVLRRDSHSSTPTSLRCGGHGARRTHPTQRAAQPKAGTRRERNAVESKVARRSAQDAKLGPHLKCIAPDLTERLAIWAPTPE